MRKLRHGEVGPLAPTYRTNKGQSQCLNVFSHLNLSTMLWDNLFTPSTCNLGNGHSSETLVIQTLLSALSTDKWGSQQDDKTGLKIGKRGPGWCGSGDWALACEPKGRQFNSQSGHMPGLQARSPGGGVREATTHWCFFPSLSPSLPLSKNKY